MGTEQKQQEKLRVKKRFEKLKNFLYSQIGSRKRKLKIINKVDRETSKSKEKERNFVKFFLAFSLENYFQNYHMASKLKAYKIDKDFRIEKKEFQMFLKKAKTK